MRQGAVRTSMRASIKERPSGDQIAAASYIATLAAELGTIAHRNGLETLRYLLDMARLEAENLTRSVD
jgi:hypothetical protein